MAPDAPTVSLAELANFVNGDRGKNYPSGSDYVEFGIPFIGAADLASGSVDVGRAKKISRDAFEALRNGKVQRGDTLLCLRGSLGKVAFVGDDDEAAIASSLVILRAKPGVDHRYLYYLLTSPVVQVDALALDNGSVQPNLSVREVSKVRVPQHGPKEQRRIAHILGTLDDKIELNRRMSQTLEEMARALFKSWFVDFDPVRAKAEGRDTGLPKPLADLFPDRLVDTGRGVLPEGWRPVTVGAMCARIFSGGTPDTRAREFWGGGIPWLSSGETRRRLVTSTQDTISERGVAASSARLAPRLATVVASAGQGRTRGQASLLGIDTYINQSVVALIADPAVSSDMYLYFDLSRRYEEFRQASDGQSSRGSLTTKILAALPAICPTKDIISAFDGQATVLIERSLAAERESVYLNLMRDTLLESFFASNRY